MGRDIGDGSIYDDLAEWLERLETIVLVMQDKVEDLDAPLRSEDDDDRSGSS